MSSGKSLPAALLGVSRARAAIAVRGIQSNTSLESTRSALPDFNNSEAAFKSKTILALVRADVVFSICRVPYLVKNAEGLLKTAYRLLGHAVANSLLRFTYFGHFCAGEDANSIQPTVNYLHGNGIGSILDYAAESDVAVAAPSPSPSPTQPLQEQAEVSAIQCRVYSYKDEALCDQHVETFVRCIEAVKKVSPTGFAAIKITALGNPILLQRMSEAINELRALFSKFDSNHTGLVTKEQFLEGYSTFFTDDGYGAQAADLFARLDNNGDGRVDYMDWSNSLPLEGLHTLTSRCRTKGPLSRAVLDPEELKLLAAMRKRVDHLASLASRLGVRLMIDAEHFKFQPAIDYLTINLAKQFNGDFPVIFSTYQMYLKDSRRRLETDMARARVGKYKFACKLVRGAYMVMERQQAKELGQPDPVHDTLQATHDNYNSAVAHVIAAIAEQGPNPSVELMIASHNQKSIELALGEMQRYGLQPKTSKVYFGQLLGMADHLSFTLGGAGYKAYKYVPYGKVNEVMPYLIRRAQENSGMLGGAVLELRMLRSELKRRLFPGARAKGYTGFDFRETR